MFRTEKRRLEESFIRSRQRIRWESLMKLEIRLERDKLLNENAIKVSAGKNLMAECGN